MLPSFLPPARAAALANPSNCSNIAEKRCWNARLRAGQGSRRLARAGHAGRHFAPICAMIPFDDAIPVLNDHWEQGISTSIHAGLSEVDVRAPDARRGAGDGLRSAAPDSQTFARAAESICRADNALDRRVGLFRRAGHARRFSPHLCSRTCALFVATGVRIRCLFSRRAR